MYCRPMFRWGSIARSIDCGTSTTIPEWRGSHCFGELECEHQERLELIGQDAARYGRIAFYLAKLGRFGRQITSTALRACRQVVLRLLSFLRAQAVVLFNAASGIVKPVLRRLGLMAPVEREVRLALDKANLESIRHLGLPEDYTVHFAFDSLNDEALFIGFDEELATIEQAIQRWEDGLTSSFILFGQRGAGKTTLLNIAVSRLFDDASVVTRSAIECKMTTTHLNWYPIWQMFLR